MKKVLISCENISKSFGEKIICKNQSFGIHQGDKIGFLGVNGSGKSTILKLLAKKESLDSGNIIYRNELNLSYLPQEPIFNENLTIIEQIFQNNLPDFELFRKYHGLLYKNTNKNELISIMNEIDKKNLWNIQYRAEEFLSLVGLKDYNKKISLLSGGEKRKLDIARVFMENSEVILLDEPTNHLDIDTIEWLQKYLKEFKGTLIFVTHDRYFLDEVSNKIMEVEEGQIRFYKGSYSFYLKEKELQNIDRRRKETRRAAQLKKELKWLQRGARARTSKPKNHIDRVKELIEKSFEKKDKDLTISFSAKRLGKTILELHNISKSYSDKILIKDFTHFFQRGEKIGIIGANGSGKTTFLKIILGEIKPDKGKVKIGINTKFSYFKQEEKNFKKDLYVIDFIKDSAENIMDASGNVYSASQMLERFLFDSKKQYSRISSLSGGEKKRLFLLKSLMLGANFIILDEPTNDFDIQTLSILEDFLDEFRGNLLVVSHDRYFLDRCVDYLFVFQNGDIIKFPGNYSDYLLVKRFNEEEKKIIKPVKEKNKKDKKRLSYNEKRELEEIEKKLETLEKEKEELEKKILNEASKLSYKDFAEIQASIDNIDEKLSFFEERWLELSEKED